MTAATPTPTSSSQRDAGNTVRVPVLFLALCLLLLLGWSYCEAVAGLAGRWWSDPDYTYGFLVPVFSAVLLWVRRGNIPQGRSGGSVWGVVLLALAAAMRWLSAYFYFVLLDPLSLVPCLAGLVLFLGGWRWLRWSWPAIVFLAFMVPLPGFVAGMLSHPLQRIGTNVSTYLLQTFGVPAVAQGNVIVLTETRLNVVEACSGLRMMMLFFTVCCGAVFLVRRPLADKLMILVSAVPIAIVANVIRITATGVLQEKMGRTLTDYHAMAGWFMMPLAVLLLWMELWVLSKLLVADARAKAPAAARKKPGGAVKPRRQRGRM